MTDKPAATGSGEPLLADQRCCACGKRFQEHAGRDNLCYTDGRTLTFKPTPPASQPTVTQLHGLVESLAFAYRGYLPHEDAPDFSNDTRTRIAFIEDILRRADALLRAAEQK